LVVVDNSSVDATFAIAQQFADVACQCGPERSAQRNAGAALASGEVLFFVDSDMVLEPNVVAEVAQAFSSPDVAGVVVPERSFGSTFWARAKALEKLAVDGDPAVEAARAFRREAFAAAGGFDERLNAFEDWDVADRVCAAGQVVRTRSLIWHDEGALKLRGTFAKKRYYGTWLPASDVPVMRRRRNVKSAVRVMWPRPVLAVGLVLMKSVELCGFFSGARRARRARRAGASGGVR
jgi:glycosyltransferase involved in cell wall biosynthesis